MDTIFCLRGLPKKHSREPKRLCGSRKWVVPENIHTHTTGGISEFRRGGGVTSTGILKGRGITSTGILRTCGGGGHWTGIPKAYGGFQESNFQFVVVVSSRKSCQKRLI